MATRAGSRAAPRPHGRRGARASAVLSRPRSLIALSRSGRADTVERARSISQPRPVSADFRASADRALRFPAHGRSPNDALRLARARVDDNFRFRDAPSVRPRAQDTLRAPRDTTADSTARQQDSMARTIQRLAPVVTVSRDVGPLGTRSSVRDHERESRQPASGTAASLPIGSDVVRVFPESSSRIGQPLPGLRVAIRGFGSRSSFGVRSIRLLRDGMPLTNADGQTPIDYLDLESIGRIEVIRGTASSLYGNASGGVIDMRSADAPGRSVRGAASLRRRNVRDVAIHRRRGRFVRERKLRGERRPYVEQQLS